MRSERLQFHLSTAIILLFWVGSAIWVWTSRKPWVFASQRIEKTLEAKDINLAPVAPDERRMVVSHVDEGPLNEFPVFDVQDFHNPELTVITLSQIDVNEHAEPIRFLDNDTLEFAREVLTKDYELVHNVIYTYKRRFPEWWWGHFYRPEVWLFILLSAALLFVAIRNRRSAKKNNSEIQY